MIYGEKIMLRYARLDERKHVYEMGISTEILRNSNDENLSTLQDFEDDYTDGYFDGRNAADYAGLMICPVGKPEKPVGFISYGGDEYLKPGTMELDIWMDGEQSCGKGFGVEAIVLLMEQLNREYNVAMFFMCPHKVNTRAIRAYEKAGLAVVGEQDRIGVVKSLYTDEGFNDLARDGEALGEKYVFMVKRLGDNV